MKTIGFGILSVTMLVSGESSAATFALVPDRQAFTLMTGTSKTDDYENPNYRHVMSDAAMSAVFGETRYFTYGGNITDYNNIVGGFGVDGSQAYCSLCYGSFRLSFDNTSLADAGGVYGVGMDITENSGAIFPFTYSAIVAFGDGMINTFQLPYVAPNYPAPPVYQFWGIVSDAGVRSIDLITHSASGEDRTFLIIDNLTIAAAPVPEPSTLVLMLSGLSLLFMRSSFNAKAQRR